MKAAKQIGMHVPGPFTKTFAEESTYESKHNKLSNNISYVHKEVIKLLNLLVLVLCRILKESNINMKTRLKRNLLSRIASPLDFEEFCIC